MAKRKKNTHNNNSTVEVAKNQVWEEYFNTKALAMAPANDEFKKRLAFTLVEWARAQKEPAIIEDFCDDVGVPLKTYEMWINQNAELKEAHLLAKQRLASLRIKNGTKGDWNWSACRWTLSLLDPKYLSHEKDLEAVKQKPDTQAVAAKDRVVEVPVWIEKDGSIAEVEMKAE